MFVRIGGRFLFRKSLIVPFDFAKKVQQKDGKGNRKEMNFMKVKTSYIRICFLMVWLAASVLFTSNLFLRYDSLQPNKPPLEFRDIIAFFTACVVCGTLIFHVINIELNNSSNEKKISIDRDKLAFDKAKLEHDKKVLASQLIGEWGRKDIVDHATAAKKFADYVKNKDEKEYSITYNNLNETQRDSIVTILNFLERISTSVEGGFVDEKTIKAYYVGIFKFYATYFSLFIDLRRRAIPYDGFCEVFFRVSNKWKS